VELLELRDVIKHYRGADEEVRAVDGVSFTIARGEMLAMRGPSGSGKTTLLLLIAGLLSPDSGVVRFDGRDVAAMTKRQVSEYLLKDVGFVFQHYHLMGGVTALENAARKLLLAGCGLAEARARALPWLERVGLGDRIEHTPERLSGGERQRVAIARALASEPRLILADEPTGSLDSTRSRQIVGLLQSIAHEQGTGVLLATHDHDAAEIADSVRTLRDGKLLALDGENGDDAETSNQPYSL
jgi:putative ABC transport system ATP-binding protein